MATFTGQLPVLDPALIYKAILDMFAQASLDANNDDIINVVLQLLMENSTQKGRELFVEVSKIHKHEVTTMPEPALRLEKDHARFLASLLRHACMVNGELDEQAYSGCLLFLSNEVLTMQAGSLLMSVSKE